MPATHELLKDTLTLQAERLGFLGLADYFAYLDSLGTPAWYDEDDCPLTAAEVEYYDRLSEVHELVRQGHAISVDDACAQVGYCGDIVEIATEDGPGTGRCLAPTVDGIQCEGHLAQRHCWQAENEWF